ncbi:MAG: efflux RND transporter permease subunit, partial [Flavobacterium sp.]|nr:efflux RND transporter permease subunit [Flavobacterium sp.]
MDKLLKQIISFSLKNKWMIFAMTLGVTVLGYLSFKQTPIEAFPDVINSRIVIITQWPGRSAEEVEKFVTIPLETEMNVVPNKTNLRSVSLFGLSVVTILFDDGVDDFTARQSVANQLRNVSLPDGVESEIQPPSGPTGEIYRYTLESKTKTVRELKEIQDWLIDKRLKSVPGVADVISFGGEAKTYEVELNPFKLSEYNLVAEDVFNALEENNGNVGGDVVNKGQQA